MKQSGRKGLLFTSVLLLIQPAYACITCNKQTQDAIFDSMFYVNLLSILGPFIVSAILVAFLSSLATRRYNKAFGNHPSLKANSYVPLTAAATIIGIGMGGFIDGIVLHQTLQWHEMLSNKIPPITLQAKSVNMFWDGIFHLFTFLITLTGIIMLWQLLFKRGINVNGRLFSGGMLLGWALFNILEGLANHHILKLHNVRELSASKEAWNFGFLLFSIILAGAGLVLIQKGRKMVPVEKA